MVKAGMDIPYTSEFMVGAMTSRKKIEESLYFSGVDKLDLLIDIDLLIKEAKLTTRQQEVVELYFYNQYTQEEVSEVLGISQQAVLDHIKKVKVKIQKVLERWKTKDEQYNNR